MEELKPTALSFWVSSLFQNSLLEQQVTCKLSVFVSTMHLVVVSLSN